MKGNGPNGHGRIWGNRGALELFASVQTPEPGGFGMVGTSGIGHATSDGGAGKLKDHNGLLVPIGVALWAHVSEDVDLKLESQQKKHMPFRLAPHEWKSGEIPWLLAVLAPNEVAQALVNKLETTVFKNPPIQTVCAGFCGSWASEPKEGKQKAFCPDQSAGGLSR